MSLIFTREDEPYPCYPCEHFLDLKKYRQSIDSLLEENRLLRLQVSELNDVQKANKMYSELLVNMQQEMIHLKYLVKNGLSRKGKQLRKEIMGY